MELPSAQELDAALTRFGAARCIITQEAMYPWKIISASMMLALGFRESGLRNVCGGATWDGTKWVQAYTDRGIFQIADTVSSEAEWLAKQEGCANGKWTAASPPVAALADMHVPRFTPALDYVKGTLYADVALAARSDIPAAEQGRFAVAAHNAGSGGALKGWREGDVDKYTAMGNYSAYVMALAPLIHDWIISHPEYRYA